MKKILILCLFIPSCAVVNGCKSVNTIADKYNFEFDLSKIKEVIKISKKAEVEDENKEAETP